MIRRQDRSAASWVFGLLLLAFLVWVFAFAPETLPEYKQRMLGIFLASLAGLFAFFLTGDIGLDIQSKQLRFGKLAVKATGGAAAFVLVLVWWWSPFTPIGVEKRLDTIQRKTESIHQDTQKIVVLLEQELSIKNAQIIFLQGQVEQFQAQGPSPRARELAARIPSDANPYALALKAIAEGRFDDARRLLGEAQKTKEVELVPIYQARAETEMYDGRYSDAVGWYEKALSLNPDDPRLLNGIGVALFYAGNYVKAESLLQQALVLRKQVFGPEHPDVATILNNLGILYSDTQRLSESEKVLQEALRIYRQLSQANPQAYLPDVAMTLNNLGALYLDTHQLSESEKVLQEALQIRRQLAQQNPSAYLPDVAATLNNLAIVEVDKKDFRQAQMLISEAVTIRRSLWKRYPTAYGNYLAESLNVEIQLLQHNGADGTLICERLHEMATVALREALKQWAKEHKEKVCKSGQ